LSDTQQHRDAKGAKVFIKGALRARKWQDRSGADRYSTEIHLTQ